MGELILIVVVVLAAAWALSMVATLLRGPGGSLNATTTSAALRRPSTGNIWRFVILAALAAAAYWHWKAS